VTVPYARNVVRGKWVAETLVRRVRDEPQLRVLREAGMHLVVRWLVAPHAERMGEQRYVDMEKEVRHPAS